MQTRLLIVYTIAFTILLGGCTPANLLLDAAERGDLEEVKVLLKEGGRIDEVSNNKFGWTPLMGAIYHNHTNVVHYLIARGANVNIADTSGKTPLMEAMALGDAALPIVKDLIAHGADVNATDKTGVTVLSYAESMPPKPGMVEVVRNAIEEQAKRKSQ